MPVVRRLPQPLVRLGLAAALACVIAAPLASDTYGVLAVVVPLALVAGLVLLRHPWLGVLVFVFFIPFDNGKLPGILSSLTPTKLAGAACLALAAFQMMIRVLPPRVLSSPLWIPLGLFFVLNVISMLFSVYPETAEDEFKEMVIALLVFTLCLVFLRDGRAVERMTLVLLAGIVITALLGIVGYILRIPDLTIGADGRSLLRAVGGLNDPNIFSAVVIFGIPLSALWIARPGPGLARLAGVAALGILVTGAVLSQSRGGFLVMLATMAMMAWRHRGLITLRRLGLVVVAGCLGTITVISLAPDSFWARQASVFVDSGPDRSLGRRASYLFVAADGLLESPLLGHGPGTFPDLYAQSAWAPKFQRVYDPYLRRQAHNTYVEVLIGSGIPGLALWLTVVALALRDLRFAQRTLRARGDPQGADLADAWLIAGLSLLAYLMILSFLNLKLLWVTLAVSTLMAERARALEREAHADPIPPPPLDGARR